MERNKIKKKDLRTYYEHKYEVARTNLDGAITLDSLISLFVCFFGDVTITSNFFFKEFEPYLIIILTVLRVAF